MCTNYTQERRNTRQKLRRRKLQEQLEKEEEETKKKFFVGKPKLVDGRYQHVSKSRSKGSFAYEHGKKDKNRQSAIASATREGNKHGLHHHNWQQKHHKGFVESLEGAHKRLHAVGYFWARRRDEQLDEKSLANGNTGGIGWKLDEIFHGSSGIRRG